jgi:hypothetical protein
MRSFDITAMDVPAVCFERQYHDLEIPIFAACRGVDGRPAERCAGAGDDPRRHHRVKRHIG